jgi:hypothetical protein
MDPGPVIVRRVNNGFCCSVSVTVCDSRGPGKHHASALLPSLFGLRLECLKVWTLLSQVPVSFFSFRLYTTDPRFKFSTVARLVSRPERVAPFLLFL